MESEESEERAGWTRRRERMDDVFQCAPKERGAYWSWKFLTVVDFPDSDWPKRRQVRVSVEGGEDHIPTCMIRTTRCVPLSSSPCCAACSVRTQPARCAPRPLCPLSLDRRRREGEGGEGMCMRACVSTSVDGPTSRTRVVPTTASAMPTIDPIVGSMRTAEGAFAHDGVLDSGGGRIDSFD
jgi:hypothetical protein